MQFKYGKGTFYAIDCHPPTQLSGRRCTESISFYSGTTYVFVAVIPVAVRVNRRLVNLLYSIPNRSLSGSVVDTKSNLLHWLRSSTLIPRSRLRLHSLGILTSFPD